MVTAVRLNHLKVPVSWQLAVLTYENDYVCLNIIVKWKH